MIQTDLLSQREKEVVALLLQGKSNKQIALALGIADSTVEFHLTNVYAKLEVNSRTEAILKLGKSIGGIAVDEPGESGVDGKGEHTDNGEKLISSRRISMKNVLFVTGAVLFTTVLLIAFIVIRTPVTGERTSPSQMPDITQVSVTATLTITPPPTASASSREYILEQIRQLAAEYDQSVQAAKKNGNIEMRKDQNSGEDIFVFTGETYLKISELHSQFLLEKTRLEEFYTQLYRDESRPTPFPTQQSLEQNKASYELMMGQMEPYCSLEAWQQDLRADSVMVYNPDEGSYETLFMGEVIARCDIFGQMLEEFRVAPLLAKINQDADMALIRQVTGKPALKLVFHSIAPVANAPWQNAALYKDETGTKYYVDVESTRLAQIEPNFPSHPTIAEGEIKSLDELRGIAGQFGLTNSPRLSELDSVLLYEEGGKEDMRFFTWSYRNKDWSGTDWVMMPPFLQVGVLANGQIATYINTLDLYE